MTATDIANLTALFNKHSPEFDSVPVELDSSPVLKQMKQVQAWYEHKTQRIVLNTYALEARHDRESFKTFLIHHELFHWLVATSKCALSDFDLANEEKLADAFANIALAIQGRTCDSL